MWPKRNQEQDLRVLVSKIDGAPEPTRDLVAEILQRACPRLTFGITPSDLVVRLIEAEAWVELGLWLIGWELPDWSVHQLCRGDHSWNCSIGIRGLARNYFRSTTSPTFSTTAYPWQSSAPSWTRSSGRLRDRLRATSVAEVA